MYAFHNGSSQARYNGAAAMLTWERTLAYFAELF
jgi:dienelactone hydrolase